MEFFICENCSYKTKFNIKVCPNCDFVLKLVIPKKFEIVESTQVFIPSIMHQLTPYYILLLKDEFGNFYPKKTMVNKNIGEIFDWNENNFSNYLKKGKENQKQEKQENLNSVTITKKKNSYFRAINFLFENTYISSSKNSKSFKDEFSNTNNLKFLILISNNLAEIGPSELKYYLDFLSELKDYLLNQFQLNKKNIVYLYKEGNEKILKNISKLDSKINIIQDLNNISENFSIINLTHIFVSKKFTFLSKENLKQLYNSNDSNNSNLNKSNEILNINYMNVISKKINSYSIIPMYPHLLLSSSNSNSIDTITKEILCENLSNSEKINILNTEIIGENLEAVKINVLDNNNSLKEILNCKKLINSNILDNFITKNNFKWNHQKWEELLEEIKKNKININPDLIGTILEIKKEVKLNEI